MSTFNLTRRRDATASVRGYYYQTQTTLRRWLELTSQGALELECGEDVDTILAALASATSGERVRILEQVKDLASRLTLRSPSVREALAYFAEHRLANPEVDLHLRFTTTAAIGTERKSSLPDGLPGLVAWERLRNGDLAAGDAVRAREAIRSILRSDEPPSGVAPAAWQALQTFVTAATDDELQHLIEHVEWSTEQSDVRNQRDELIETLQTKALVGSPAEAADTYSYLIAYIFQLLATDGPKTLSQALLLQVVAERPGALENRLRLSTLESLLSDHDVRIQRLEAAQLEGIAQAQGKALREEGIPGDVAFSPAAITRTPPKIVTRLSDRAAAVSTILSLVRAHTWTSLVGPIGMGKTTLALLVWASFNRGTWLRFRDLDPRACSSILRTAIPFNDPQAVREAVGEFLVLEDLPDLPGHDSLSDDLISVAHLCSQAGVKLLTTGHHRPSSHLSDKLGEGTLAVVDVPTLTVDEIREVLAAYDAPAEHLEQSTCELVLGLSSGHPVLAAAYAAFLRDGGWRDASRLIELLKGQPLQQERDAVAFLISSVAAEPCRDLLYRLCVASLGLSEHEVLEIANLRPTLTRALECLAKLDGVWLQSEGEERVVVSPLIRRLGWRHLSPELLRSTNAKLARIILARKSLGIDEISKVVSHLYAALEFDAAGALLGQVLMTAADEPKSAVAIFTAIADLGAPAMRRGVRLMLRTSQMVKKTANAAKLSEYAAGILVDADNCTGADKLAATAALGQLILVGESLTDDHLLGALSRLVGLSREGVAIPTAPEVTIVQFTSLTGYWLARRGHAEPFLEKLDEIGEEIWAPVFFSSEGRDLAALIAMGAVERPHPPDTASGWVEAYEALERIHEWAVSRSLDPLLASTGRQTMVILAERLGRHETATTLGHGLLSNVHAESPDRIPIVDGLARVAIAQANYEEASRQFDTMLATESTEYAIWRALASVDACVIEAELGDKRSREVAERAVRVTEGIEGWIRIRAFVHLAIACWDNGDRAEAYDALARAARLVDMSELDDDMRVAWVLIGHAAGYFMSHVTTGRSPSTADGSDYVAPSHLLLQRTDDEIRARFNPLLQVVLPIQLATFAAAVARAEEADYWAGEAYERARESRVASVVRLAAPFVACALIVRGEVTRALAVGIAAGKAAGVVDRARAAGRPALQEVIPEAPAPGERTRAEVEREEREAAAVSLMPIALRVIGLYGEDDQRTFVTATQAALSNSLDSGDIVSPLWGYSREACKMFLDEEGAPVSLIGFANGLPEEETVAKIVCYLLASAHPDSRPEHAAMAQLKVLPMVVKLLEAGEHGGVLAPLWQGIVGMWQKKFATQRFRFAAPRSLEQTLTSSDSSVGVRALKAVLRGVCQATLAKTTTEEDQWLREGGD